MQQHNTGIDVYLDKMIGQSTSAEAVQTLIQSMNEKKNIDYSTWSKHIFKSLEDRSFGFQRSLDILCNLSPLWKELNLRPNSRSHIFQGFLKYWRSLEPQFPTQEHRLLGLSKYSQVDTLILEKQLECFYDLEYALQHQKQITEDVHVHLQKRQIYRALILLKCFKIEDKVQEEVVVQALCAAEPKIHEFDFYLKKRPHLYSAVVQKSSHKFGIQIIRKFSLKPSDFPQLMWQLQKNSLEYSYRSFSPFQYQMRHKDVPEHLSYFAIQLYRQSYYDEALSIIRKYDLYDNKIFKLEKKLHLVQEAQKKNKIPVYQNPLQEFDDFGATELRVLGQPIDFLELCQFGISQKQVHFIDQIGDSFQEAQAALLSNQEKVVGFDVETGSAMHTFDSPSTQLLQLSTLKQIFIFDVPKLKTAPQFTKLVTQLFSDKNTKTSIVGHSVSGDVSNIRSAIKATGQFCKIHDTQTIFKDGKSPLGLKDLAVRFFGKPISKYQQCSGWQIRPLRRAQLHYAALDAHLVLQLFTRFRPKA